MSESIVQTLLELHQAWCYLETEITVIFDTLLLSYEGLGNIRVLE